MGKSTSDFGNIKMVINGVGQILPLLDQNTTCAHVLHTVRDFYADGYEVKLNNHLVKSDRFDIMFLRDGDTITVTKNGLEDHATSESNTINKPLATISLLGEAEEDLTPDGKITMADAVKMMKYDPAKHIVTYNGAITPPDQFNQLLQDADLIVMVESKNAAGQKMLDRINAGVAARQSGQPDAEQEPLTTTGGEITFIWQFSQPE